MRHTIPIPTQPFRQIALLASSAMLLAAAGLAARLAAGHMAEVGAICGGAAPHCGWCASAVALTLSGAAATWAALANGAVGVRLESRAVRRRT